MRILLAWLGITSTTTITIHDDVKHNRKELKSQGIDWKRPNPPVVRAVERDDEGEDEHQDGPGERVQGLVVGRAECLSAKTHTKRAAGAGKGERFIAVCVWPRAHMPPTPTHTN